MSDLETGIVPFVGAKLASVAFEDTGEYGAGTIRVTFEDGRTLLLRDMSSCCENRYFRTDDDLDYFKGATLLRIEEGDVEEREAEYGRCHEMRFLRVSTSLGVFVICCHNEHNGYYSGFNLRVIA